MAQSADDTRAATGGAQTLEDIMARQSGVQIDDEFRSTATGIPNETTTTSGRLGTLGGVSDPELWRALRYGSADIISSTSGPGSTVIIQDGGMRWLQVRGGVLPTYGGYLLLAMMAVILAFYLIRGKIMIEGGKTGITILRFSLVERIAHWAMALPFIFLAITGLALLFGRVALIPLFGKGAFSVIATTGKVVHNYVAWVFIAGLILSFLLWALKNIPNGTDIRWLLKGGGLFSRGVHPSAGKFNAGEKIIFWIVMIFGGLITLTGLALLFPYQITVFAPVLDLLNSLGISQLLGMGEVGSALSPQEEMQYAQFWHVILGFVLMAVIIAHIYLGSVGMEGALDSMKSGKVDVQWAKEHHDLWYDEISAATPNEPSSTPAE
jgi:formate dehydrogenase subunit gamma